MFSTITTTTISLLLLSPPYHPPLAANFLRRSPPLLSFPSSLVTRPPRNSFRVRSDEFDEPAEFFMGDIEIDDADEEQDYDPEYEPLGASAGGATDLELALLQGRDLFSVKGWENETVVDYRINEDEFHKISLLDCDFFIRKPPDPDNDVYDFSEMYVTPPDTDVYAIPKILAPMPQKLIRCAASDYLSYHVTEPPISAPREPMYKSDKEIFKVFLIKHYGNRRLADPDFVLDFEEIYVIDSKTKSITRAKVVVTAPGGRNRDRKDDMLVIRDNGVSFKIIHRSEKMDPTEVIEREDWEKSRRDMEKHLSKLRDFNVSNWF